MKAMTRAELNELLAVTHASIKRIETGRGLGLTVDDWSRIQREARRKVEAAKRSVRLARERAEGLMFIGKGV